MTNGVLPALVGGSVVRVVLGDVAVDAAERELLVGGGGHGLHDELRVTVGRLGVVPRLARVPRLAHVAHVPHVTHVTHVADVARAAVAAIRI